MRNTEKGKKDKQSRSENKMLYLIFSEKLKKIKLYVNNYKKIFNCCKNILKALL